MLPAIELDARGRRLLAALAVGQGGAAIYPKEVIDAAGTGPLKQFIGTGPFRLVEHRPKGHVRLARFKEYTARNEPPNGTGGKRVAYLDELLFVAVARWRLYSIWHAPRLSG
jgi:peptide/nickel transport system substrate-binding protein